MISFREFFDEFVVKWEGGYSDDPQDSGGKTMYGITEKELPGLVAKGIIKQKGIKEITKDDSFNILNERYFISTGINQLPYPLSYLVVDMEFNAGTYGRKLLQRILGVTEDAILGPKTLEAVKKRDLASLCIEYLLQRCFYYKECKSFKAHGKGWLNRVHDLYRYMSKF